MVEITNPVIKELKRRLTNTDEPLPKRLKLAQNSLKCSRLPLQRETVILDWYKSVVIKENTGDCLNQFFNWDDLSGMVEVFIAFLNSHKNVDVKILKQLVQLMVDEKLFQPTLRNIQQYFTILKSLLVALKPKSKDLENLKITESLLMSVQCFFKKVLRKNEFVSNFVCGEFFEVILEYIDISKSSALSVIKTVLFPTTKIQLYTIFLSALIKEESIDKLIEEKGDKLKPIIKIMTEFFTFPSGRRSLDTKFLERFIESFVYAYNNDSKLIYLFFVTVFNSLNVGQDYLNLKMSIPPWKLGSNKIKKHIYYKCMELILSCQDVDLTISLTDSSGVEKSKSETKKYFSSFLLSTTLAMIKEDKFDSVTLKIILTYLKIDPTFIQDIEKCLPKLIVTKKTEKISPIYRELMVYVLELEFKMSQGMDFLSSILPLVKVELEGLNEIQFRLRQSFKEDLKLGKDCMLYRDSILTCEDLFPDVVLQRYGELCSTLLFRQVSELFTILQREFETNSLMMLEDGFISPSILILAEILSKVIGAVMVHAKMADHTVPLSVSQEFWRTYDLFQRDVLAKFAACVVKLTYDAQLTRALLDMISNYTCLHLLRHKSSTDLTKVVKSVSHIDDMSDVLPEIESWLWLKVGEKIRKADDVAALEIWNKLLLQRLLFYSVTETQNNQSLKHAIKMHLIKDLNSIWCLMNEDTFYLQVLLDNLESHSQKALSKFIANTIMKNPEKATILCNEALTADKVVRKGVLMELVKRILKVLEGNGVGLRPSLYKCLNDENFDIEKFTSQLIDVTEYFENLNSFPADSEVVESIELCLGYIKQLNIEYFDENSQLIAVFVLLALKRAGKDVKRVRKSIDSILLSLFEMTAHCPDVFKIFPVDYIFKFDGDSLIELATLKTKQHSRMLPVRVILEKSLNDDGIARKIVKLLTANQKLKTEDISYFTNEVFQISCLFLPLISRKKKSTSKSQVRTTLTEIEDKLHRSLMKCFKRVTFDMSSENKAAILNAVDAYTLVLANCCECGADDLNFEVVSRLLEDFFESSIKSIKNPELKRNDILSCISLINTTLRFIKKFDRINYFNNVDALLKQVYEAVKVRLHSAYTEQNKSAGDCSLVEFGLCLKFVCELCSVELFSGYILSDLSNMFALKPLNTLMLSEVKYVSNLSAHRIANYTIQSMLKSNISGLKLASLGRMPIRIAKNISVWLRANYNRPVLDVDEVVKEVSVQVEEKVCHILKCDLNSLAELILSTKKVTLSYKAMDAIFECCDAVCTLISCDMTNNVTYLTSDMSYMMLYDGLWMVLNNLLVGRDELLEDRWPCYLRHYRDLIVSLCIRSGHSEKIPDGFNERALALEKLTQSLVKKKQQLSTLSGYLIADICHNMELNPPHRDIKQSYINCVLYLFQLMQTMSFVKRALSESHGVVMFTQLYSMYKSLHKYTGQS